MKNHLLPGATRTFRKLVTAEDLASFNGEVVHPVCSTFSLAQALEWTSRLFALEIKEEDEEAVGTFLEIRHMHPAFPGETIDIVAELLGVQGNEIRCRLVARVGNRTIAEGETGQKIFRKEKLAKLLNPNRF